MPSRFEIYKQSISKDRELETDIQELEKLYTSQKSFYNKYTFDDFVKLSIDNADGEFDHTIKDFFSPSKPTDKLKENPNYYKDVFGVTEEEREEKELFAAEGRGWKSTRRTLVSPYSETTAALVGLVPRAISKATDTLFPGVGNITNKFLPDQEDIDRRVDKIFRPLAGKDIYEKKTDPKTGEVYYELEEPTTTTESILRPAGEIAAAFAVTRRPTDKAVDVLKQGLTAPKRLRGRPSKTQLALEERAAKRLGQLDTVSKRFGTIGQYEVASQFTFADDPDFGIVAGTLSNYIGEDDNRLSALINYLDTDDDSPEAARRLTLLVDGLTFAGVFGTVIGGGKLTVKGVTNLVNKVKSEGPEAVAKFKELILGARQSDSATKLTKPKPEKIDVPLINNLDIVEEDSLLNKAWGAVQKGIYNFTTRGGMYAPGMLDIIKSSEYNKIAWSTRAMDIHSQLVLNINKVAKGSQLKTDEIEELFQHYLTGQKKGKKTITLKDLPKEIRESALDARNNIDKLSTMLANSTYIPKNIRDEIKTNMGKYLRKTYEAFENPNYKPSNDVYNRAVNEIKKGLQATDANAGRQRPRPSGWYDQEARKFVDGLLNKNKGKAFNNFESHINAVFGAKKAEKVFQARKNITPAINELLGGQVPASTSVFRTIETLSNEISQYKLMDDLYKQGKGKWFFTGKGKSSVAPDERMVAAKITGQGFHKLNGVNTTEGIARLFEKMSETSSPHWLVQGYGKALTLKGFSQAAATVYNLTTHVRNTVGGGIILARNGMNPFTDDTTQSLKTVYNQIIQSPKGKDKALGDLYIEYQSLGLVNQNVKVGEFKRLFNDYINLDKESLITNPLKAQSKFSKINKKITDIYVGEDDIWRITGYNKELETLQRAYPNRNLNSLKREAANIIRDTMPTYDLISPGVQILRQAPIGNFFSFTAEQYRNNYNTIIRGMDEIRTGNEVLVERGLKRLASQIVVTYAGAKGATDFTKMAFGVTDEDEKALKHLGLPEWSKSSALIFDRDEKGNIEYIDLTYTDPSAPVTDVLRAFLNEATDPTIPSKFVGDKVLEGMKESMMLFLKPFTGPAILTDKILDITFNKGRDYETNKLVDGYNPAEGSLSLGNIMAGFKHLSTGVIPREIQDDISLIAGKKREKIKRGEASLGNELFSRLTGQRTQVVTPAKLKRDFYFKMFDLNKRYEGQRDFLKGSIKQGVTPDELLNAYKRANSNYYSNFSDAKLALEAAHHFDVDRIYLKNTVQSTLRFFTNGEKSNFLDSNNSFIPLRFTESQLRNIRNKGDFSTMSFTTFYEEYNNMFYDYHYLPIIEDINNEYRTYAPEELMRLTKSVGGIVEGEDNVPFTKENPADRVNPFTGEPYQEQMDRLGFSNGGPKLSSDQKMYLTFYNLAKEAGVAYPAAVAAQASLESGHGTSELATKYNNPLGIKVNRPSEIKQGQPSVQVKTQEFVEGKEGTEIEPFRIYNNLAESFIGYKEKVAAPRYDSIRQAKNEDEYLTAIANSGYATDPLYAEKTIKIKNRYANLIPKD